MKKGRFIQGTVPVLLSAVFPGLGQWYNKEIWKGAAFFMAALVSVGVLLSQIDTDTLQRLHESGVPPRNLGTIFLCTMILFGVLFWSMYDAGRSKTHAQRKSSFGGNKQKSENPSR